MKNELSRLSQAMLIKTNESYCKAKRNLFTSCNCNANLFKLLAILALPFGVIGHEGSTILVILNGLRLLKTNKNGSLIEDPSFNGSYYARSHYHSFYALDANCSFVYCYFVVVVLLLLLMTYPLFPIIMEQELTFHYGNYCHSSYNDGVNH